MKVPKLCCMHVGWLVVFDRYTTAWRRESRCWHFRPTLGTFASYSPHWRTVPPIKSWMLLSLSTRFAKPWVGLNSFRHPLSPTGEAKPHCTPVDHGRVVGTEVWPLSQHLKPFVDTVVVYPAVKNNQPVRVTTVSVCLSQTVIVTENTPTLKRLPGLRNVRTPIEIG
jgi:hypothetical protein